MHDILHSWWFSLAFMVGVPVVAGWIVNKVRKDARLSRLMALGVTFAIEAVPIIEERFPKGLSPGAGKKLNEALVHVQNKLRKEGYSVEVMDPTVKAALEAKINEVHAGASAYKNVHTKVMGGNALRPPAPGPKSPPRKPKDAEVG